MPAAGAERKRRRRKPADKAGNFTRAPCKINLCAHDFFARKALALRRERNIPFEDAPHRFDDELRAQRGEPFCKRIRRIFVIDGAALLQKDVARIEADVRLHDGDARLTAAVHDDARDGAAPR